MHMHISGKGALVDLTADYLSYTADGALDCKGPLSSMIALYILAEVNQDTTASGQKKKMRFISLLHTHREVGSSPIQQYQ